MSTICILHIDHTATSSVIRATRSRAHSRLFSTNFLPCFLWLLLLWFVVKKKRKPCSGPLYGLLRWSPMANIKEFLLGPLCIASCIYADETQPWNGSDIDRSPKSSVLLLCCCYDVVDIFFFLSQTIVRCCCTLSSLSPFTLCTRMVGSCWPTGFEKEKIRRQLVELRDFPFVDQVIT